MVGLSRALRHSRVPLSFAAVKLLGHLLFNACNHTYGYFGDEFYYLACGRHPAFGYVDHPPLVPLLARASDLLIGESVFAVRVVPALASAAVVFLTGLLSQELGGKAFAQAMACWLVVLAPVFLRTGLLLETVEFDQLVWALVGFCVVRFLIVPRPRSLWLVGLLVGIGCEVKYTILVLALGLLVGFAATPARRHLATRHAAIGILLTVVVASPNLVWQVQHGWPTLEFLRHAHADRMADISVPSFLLAQQGMLHVLAAFVALVGFYPLVARAPLRPLGIAAVTVLGLLAFAGSKPYYFAAMYPVLLAAGSTHVESWASRAPRLARCGLRLGLILGASVPGLLFLPAALPILPPEQLAAFLLRIEGRTTFRDEDSHRPLRLPQDYAAMMGWDDFVGAVAEVYAGLPAEEKRHAGVLTQNWTEAGAIDWLGARRGLPGAMSGNNSYYLWGPTPAAPDVVVAVGFRAETLLPFFDDVSEARRIVSEFARETNVTILVCRKPRVPFAHIWPDLRHYD